MMQTSGLDMSDTVNNDMVDIFIHSVAWTINSTYHTVLDMLPCTAIFGTDMLFDVPYLVY